MWRITYKMPVKFISRQSPETKLPLLILQNQSLELATIGIIINVVISGYSGENLKWLVHVTLRSQVSDYSQLSEYTVRLQLCGLIKKIQQFMHQSQLRKL